MFLIQQSYKVFATLQKILIYILSLTLQCQDILSGKAVFGVTKCKVGKGQTEMPK